MKNKIIKIFTSSGLNIISYDYLEEYVDFCLENNNYIKGKTSLHHILPKAKNLPFAEYSDVKLNHKWNGVYLTYANHYKAHYILTKAINHYSINFAFMQMHNKDIKNKRLEDCDLINLSDYQIAKELCYSSYSVWLDSEIVFEETLITNRTMLSILQSRDMNKVVYDEDTNEYVKQSAIIAKKGKETKNSKEWRDTVGVESISKMKATKRSTEYMLIVEPTRLLKQKESLNQITENGLTVAANAGLKISKTVTVINPETGKSIAQERSMKSGESKRTTIQDNGKSISQNAAAKAVRTMRKVGEDGMTIYQKTGLKSSEYQRNKGKWFKLCHINGLVINERISNAEVKEICPRLLRTTKEKYLGYNTHSKRGLNISKKLHLVGLYLIEI